MLRNQELVRISGINSGHSEQLTLFGPVLDNGEEFSGLIKILY